MTWKEEIIRAFEALDGIASYSQLYHYIETHTSRNLSPAWKATVRREVENHSSDSDNFTHRDDVFYSVSGLGRGVWGLRSMVIKTPKANDIQEPAAPQRQRIEVSRIIRNTRITQHLKQLYKNKCQICGKTINLKNHEYSEGHHIQPLGQDHKGPDIASNIIIVCPNHHAEFDYGAIGIDPLSRKVIHIDGQNEFIGKYILMEDGHDLDKKYLDYHFNHIFDTV